MAKKTQPAGDGPPAAPEGTDVVAVQPGHTIQANGREMYGPGETIELTVSEADALIARGVVGPAK